MKIASDQTTSPSIDVNSTASVRAAKVSTPTQPATPVTVEKASSPVSKPNLVSGKPETDVTFRRDQNGRIFYLVTDAKSGKELQEIPPKQVRSVGQGIEEYLKKEAEVSRSTHVEVKA